MKKIGLLFFFILVVLSLKVNTISLFQWEEEEISVVNHEAKAVYFRFMGEYNGWVELSVLKELGYTHEILFRNIHWEDQIDLCPYIIFTHDDGTLFDSRNYEDQTMCVRASDVLRRGFSSGDDYDINSLYRLIGTNMVGPMLQHVSYTLYVNGYGYHPVTLDWFKN